MKFLTIIGLVASREGVSGEASGADTHWRVTDHAALSVSSAGARARIPALLINASQVTGTFAVADALVSTGRWRSHESWHTSAGWGIVQHLAEGIGAAR